MTTRTRLAATLLLAAAATTSACGSSPTTTSTPVPATSVTVTATTAPGTTSPATTGGEETRQEAPTTSADAPATSDAAAPATTTQADDEATPTPQATTDDTSDAESSAGTEGAEGTESTESTPTTSAPAAETPAATTSSAQASGEVRFSAPSANRIGRGYGQVRPSEISFGGDPTGTVRDITWDSWGGRTAIGHGTGSYVSPGESVSQSKPTPVTIRLSSIGTCDGHPAYRAVAWWFPTKGQTGPAADFPTTDHTAC